MKTENREFDLYEEFNIKDVILSIDNWKYSKNSDKYHNELLFYKFENNTYITISFKGYKKACDDKKGFKSMIVKMINDGSNYEDHHYPRSWGYALSSNDILFTKKIPLSFKNYFFIKKFRKIILEYYEKHQEELRKEREESRKKKEKENRIKMIRSHKDKLSRIPKSIIRDKSISDILD